MNPAYTLPKHLIAQQIAQPHDNCRLMVVDKQFSHDHFYNIANYLQKGDVLVINQTKVQHAKLIGKKSTGGSVEVLLTKPQGNNIYACRIKGANIKAGTELLFKSTSAAVANKTNDIFTITFKNTPSSDDLIIPTPPYIKRHIPEEDYQTIFAQKDGSLAAPTAALHFTPELVEKIKKKGVRFAAITLHIGFGTFLPVKDIATYKTEPEYFEVSEESADIINTATRIIPVGTTSMKTIESAAKDGKVQAMSGLSNIFIHPGYKFKLDIPAMITNFHLPDSSLLQLVCAFGGTQRILRAYDDAIKNRYQFYSLGDAMMLFRTE